MFKLFFPILGLVFSLEAVSYNKIVFVENPQNTKDLPKTYVITDYTKNFERKFLDEGIENTVHGSDFIAYIKNSSLYVITNFNSLDKIKIADNVFDLKLKNQTLFYSQNLDKTSVLYMIKDFKTLTKHQVIRNFKSYSLDDY
jgi:hypothetical protein